MSRSIHVTSSSDSGEGTLRQAVINANRRPYATIIIESSVGPTIHLTSGELVVTTDLEIVAQCELVIDTESGRIIHVIGPAKVLKLKGITLKDGKAENGGAVYVESEKHHLILENTVIHNSVASGSGGAVYTNGSLTLRKSKVHHNTAGQQGAGVWAGTRFKSYRSEVSKNVLIGDGYGGGVLVNNGDALLEDSRVVKNTAPKGSGGGLVVLNGNTTLHSSRISRNSAYNSGGLQQGTGNITAVNSKIDGNSSTNDNTGSAGGGGITITKGDVSLTDSQVVDNKTVGMYSGGIVSLVGDVKVQRSLISGNTNRGPGGGIAMNVGNLIVEESKVINNTGASLGGGIVSFTPEPGSIRISKSDVSNNVLTNAETISGTIRSFIEVVTGYLGGLEKHFPKLQEALQEVKSKLEPVHQALQKISVKGEKIGGGAVAALLSTNVHIVKSRLSGNFAGEIVDEKNFPVSALGGAVFSHNATVHIERSDVQCNRTLNFGGGIYNAGHLSLANSKVLKNTAESGGGVYSKVDFRRVHTTIEHNDPDDVVVV